MDVEVTKLDGDVIRFSERDIVVQDFKVSSIPVTGIYSTLEGRSGTVDYGAGYGQRNIEITFYVEAFDTWDYPLLRDELFTILTSREPFYVREMRSVGNGAVNDEYVGGKRYRVRVSESYNLEQQFRYGFGSVVLETVDLPFAESIGTTQDIERDGVSADGGLWGFGMGIIADDESLKYTHIGTSFKVYNAGDVLINPFEQELVVKVTNVAGATSNLEIKNTSNGILFRVNESVNRGDMIVLDGPNITKNGAQFLRSTNRRHIELVPGWNNFEISGATDARVEFDFRYYYY